MRNALRLLEAEEGNGSAEHKHDLAAVVLPLTTCSYQSPATALCLQTKFMVLCTNGGRNKGLEERKKRSPRFQKILKSWMCNGK